MILDVDLIAYNFTTAFIATHTAPTNTRYLAQYTARLTRKHNDSNGAAFIGDHRMTVTATNVTFDNFKQYSLRTVSTRHICYVLALLVTWAMIKLQCSWVLVVATVFAALRDLICVNQVTLMLCQFRSAE
jgi:hypothetical protein